ncbi:DUF559 domain-containing protein [Ruegeria atlantica]|uniref:DUF559 domain-containing protein n=1 Tax=Ruegeria atlantica TaxID=81569 RepID=UPI0024949E1C|nr:DUF559 domain-containing protein [Ruegeria atlantica]
MTPKQFKTTHVSLRIGLALVFLLFGFIFPLFWAVAAVIGGSVFFDLVPSKHDRHERLQHLTGTDANWRGSFHAYCESPAERAFLDAMIDEFDLKPKNGNLIGSGIQLNLQVPVARYRLDFLVNDRLIVEIDGAAYHSSPEAKKRDAERDADLVSEGYQVLRIPAKYPLYVPQEATLRVKEACEILQSRNREKRAELNREIRPKSVFGALSKGLKDFNEGLSECNRYVHEQTARKKEEEKRRAQEKVETDKRELDEWLNDPEEQKKWQELCDEFGLENTYAKQSSK